MDTNKDIFTLLGYKQSVGRELNRQLFSLYITHMYKLRRAAAVCQNEVAGLVDPNHDLAEGRIYYPRLCGTYLSKVRSTFDPNPDKLGELPLNVLPYLARMIRGTRFLKKYADVSKLTCSDVYPLMQFFGLTKAFILPDDPSRFSPEGAQAIAARIVMREQNQ